MRRKGLDRQGVNLSLHHRAQRIVNQPVPGRQRQTVKLCRYQQQLVVPAAAFGAFVADVFARIVEDFKRVGRQHGEALAHLFDRIERGHNPCKDRCAAQGFPPVFPPSPGLSP